jgi:hypothetical protein
MAGLAANRLDRTVALVNGNSAGVVAIARARRADDFIEVRHINRSS